ncbi:MAG: caspase family protein, partial [Azospirillaceae bacterium]
LDLERQVRLASLVQAAQSAAIGVVIVDACRDNPFVADLPSGTKSAAGLAKGLGRDLEQLARGRGTLVAYAAQPGRVALDGSGGNSPYAAALLEHIDRPIDIRLLFDAVREEVWTRTDEEQRPAYRSELPPIPIQIAPPDRPISGDLSDEIRELSDLARQGIPEAEHDLATAYALGREIPRSYPEAAYWYRRAAESGIVNAIYNLGVLYERGLGVEQDSRRAFELFKQAADEGHPDAQNAVGLAYAAGRGTEPNFTLAMKWFNISWVNGNSRGAYNLGRIFEDGIEGAPDLEAAARWYSIASEAGDTEAAAALEALNWRAEAGQTVLPDETRP